MKLNQFFEKIKKIDKALGRLRKKRENKKNYK